MATEVEWEVEARRCALEARWYYTAASVDRLLVSGEQGTRSWAEVYDILCGAVLNPPQHRKGK